MFPVRDKPLSVHVARSRVVAGIVQLLGLPDILCVSRYFWHSEGLSRANSELFAAVGSLLDRWDGLHIFAGDINMGPELVRAALLD